MDGETRVSRVFDSHEMRGNDSSESNKDGAGIRPAAASWKDDDDDDGAAWLPSSS